MESLKLRLVGEGRGMLHHNIRLADPLDPYKKRVDAALKDMKKSGTDETHMTLARVEFEAGLYFNEKLGPYVPAEWVLKSMRDSAALTKEGKTIERGVELIDVEIPIQYDGPRDVEGMWRAGMYDRRAIGIGQKKTMRTRPHFPRWAIDVSLLFVPSVIDREDLIEHANQAGLLMGIGDGRRIKFGRFKVEVVK